MSEHPESTEKTGEDVLEPMAGKGLRSYRPWDWIAGYAFAAVLAFLMFAFARSTDWF